MSKNKTCGENENKLLTDLTCSMRTGNISLSPFLYRPSGARSILPRSQANIPFVRPSRTVSKRSVSSSR